MIFGNPHIISFLDRLIASGEFSHAYLFVGPQSVGKTHVALQMTCALQATHDQAFLAFANRKKNCTCDSCKAIAQGAHPDVLFFSAPLVIENVRVLRKQLAQGPLISPFYIVIIQNIHQATPEAAQALLKLLEEPSASTVFFLTAEYISSIPSTIVSRSTTLHFFLVTQKEMRAFFEDVKQKLFEDLAPYWRGRPGRLIRLMSDKIHAQRVAEGKKRAEHFLHSSRAQQFSIAQQVASLERRDALAVLEEWLVWWEQSRAFQPLNILSRLYQTFLHTPINIQTALESLALATRRET